MGVSELGQAWQRAVTGEICWLDPHRGPAALPVIPLVDGGLPAVAVPYAQADAMAGLRAAEQVAFTVSDSRSLPAGGPGHAAIGGFELIDDLEGDYFVTELLRQELAKYPPARALADSPLLCRENWWWLPRIIVRLTRIARAERLPARGNPQRDGLLVRDDAARLETRTVRVQDWSGAQVRLAGPDRDNPTWDDPTWDDQPGDGGRAMLLSYDYSMPDLERWETWRVAGSLRAGELAVTERDGDPDARLGPLPLVDRLRRRRGLAKACRKGIEAAEGAASH